MTSRPSPWVTVGWILVIAYALFSWFCVVKLVMDVVVR